MAAIVEMVKSVWQRQELERSCVGTVVVQDIVAPSVWQPTPTIDSVPTAITAAVVAATAEAEVEAEVVAEVIIIIITTVVVVKVVVIETLFVLNVECEVILAIAVSVSSPTHLDVQRIGGFLMGISNKAVTRESMVTPTLTAVGTNF